jgi:hypothetical protein
MTYSKTHKRFADRPNNQRALEHPEEFLGVNYKDVLNFWWYLECLSEEQRKIVWERYQALGYEVRDAAWNAAQGAAYDAVQNSVAYAAEYAAAYATYELIGSHRLLEQGKSLTFLPLFLDL